jgi:LmbE family N-acetylglucosaminyl deacetylase
VPSVLHISPHPDDEALGAGATLILLRKAGWNVTTLACSFGRSAQASRRRAELVDACSRAGFDLRETAGEIRISASADHATAQTHLATEISQALTEQQPSLLVGPNPHDGHPGHEVVGRAIVNAVDSLPQPSRPRVWLWELWGLMPLPTLYVALPSDVMSLTASVLEAHRGELERNDYRRALEARAQLAAVLGFERVFGWGATAPKDAYADVLMEILCDRQPGWTLAKPRVLGLDTPLDPATASAVDIGAWLARASARQEILRRSSSVGVAETVPR